MKIKNTYIILLTIISISVFTTSCSKYSKNFCEYELKDVCYRDIGFKFNKDGTFVVDNYWGYQLYFIGYGKWKVMDTHVILVTIDGVTDTIDDHNASPQGVDINVDSALVDRSYIFPLIYNDTATFSDDYKYLNFKNYKLTHSKKTQKIKNIIKARH